MNQLQLNNLSKIEECFSTNSELQGYLCESIPDGADESLYVKLYDGCYFKTPDVNDENCYYQLESSELLKATYHPISKKLEIRSMSRQPFSLNGNLIFMESFTFITKIDYANNNIIFMGEYERTNAGKVLITFDIKGLGIENDNKPIPPNFETINYSYEIINATNSTKFKELWLSDGKDYAARCYNQAYNTLWFMYYEYGISLF